MNYIFLFLFRELYESPDFCMYILAVLGDLFATFGEFFAFNNYKREEGFWTVNYTELDL